jgi:hypothetical protein
MHPLRWSTRDTLQFSDELLVCEAKCGVRGEGECAERKLQMHTQISDAKVLRDAILFLSLDAV